MEENADEAGRTRTCETRDEVEEAGGRSRRDGVPWPQRRRSRAKRMSTWRLPFPRLLTPLPWSLTPWLPSLRKKRRMKGRRGRGRGRGGKGTVKFQAEKGVAWRERGKKVIYPWKLGTTVFLQYPPHLVNPQHWRPLWDIPLTTLA